MILVGDTPNCCHTLLADADLLFRWQLKDHLTASLANDLSARTRCSDVGPTGALEDLYAMDEATDGESS